MSRGRRSSLRFDADGLVPAVVQEAATGEVLMVAWMNAEALEQTLATGVAHFWSRSRRALWQKGETSGHTPARRGGVRRLRRRHPARLAHQEGSRATRAAARASSPASTRGAGAGDGAGAPAPGPAILDAVDRVIQSRRVTPREGSYVSGLLAGGDARIARKVGEEAAEVMVAALAEGPERLVAEVADLWFHTLVLLGARGLSARHVFAELGRRHRPATAAGAREPRRAPED